MNIYELHGRQAEQLEQLAEGYRQTLGLLKDIKDEKVNIKDVELLDSGWKINDTTSSR